MVRAPRRKRITRTPARATKKRKPAQRTKPTRPPTPPTIPTTLPPPLPPSPPPPALPPSIIHVRRISEAGPPPLRPAPARRELVIPLLLFVAAIPLYAHHIDQPSGIIFDEAHYVKVARNYTQGNLIDSGWADPRPYNFEHPPFAKYLIAGGMGLLGDNEAGRRAASVVAGASGIAAAYLLGRRLFQSVGAGLLSAAFLLLDPMYFLHARTTMLDVFPAAFTLWAFALTMSPRFPQRLAGALAFGLAISSKLPALFLLPAFILLQLLRTRPAAPWRRLLITVVLGLGVPLLVYFASYAPYYALWWRKGGASFVAEEFLLVQVAAFAWDFAGGSKHDYASPPWDWLPMLKPVWYYVGSHPDGRIAYVYSVGNPALWWTAPLAALVNGLVLVPARAARRLLRQLRSPTHVDWEEAFARHRFDFNPFSSLAFAASLFLLTYFSWFLLQRITFMFYATLFTPYLALFAGGLVHHAWRRTGRARPALVGFVVLVALYFLIFYPLASGAWVTREHYAAIRWVVPWMETHAPG